MVLIQAAHTHLAEVRVAATEIQIPMEDHVLPVVTAGAEVQEIIAEAIQAAGALADLEVVEAIPVVDPEAAVEVTPVEEVVVAVAAVVQAQAVAEDNK